MKLCPRCSEFYANEATFCPADGTALKKTNDPYLGRTIAARYRLIKRLGTGGMSSVYLARHVMIDRLSAIKILRQDLSLNPIHRERFLREARAVNRINHRNIVEITDVGEMDGVAYLVMEYVDGQSLHEELKRGALPWVRAAKVGMQISGALARAHQMGVVHRDLKPENIILVRGDDPADFVKLTDFGIAKIIDAPALTFSEQLFGTPGYIAPEAVEGLPVDRRSDLYSLGVLIYEMLTGKLPYDARGADLLTMPLRAAPIPPGQRVVGLPPELESLILGLLARKPKDRPQDAFAVYDALADLLRREGFSTSSNLPPPYLSAAPLARDESPTLVDAPLISVSIDVAPASRLTANLGKVQTSEITSRWSTALVELETSIERARRRGGAYRERAERATELLETARGMIVRIEKTSRTAADHQAKVNRLEAKGREFRTNLGRAIDELVRDRSRERAHATALSARREALVEGTRAGADARATDALVWETAALAAEADRARAREKDLTFQIDALQAELDVQNTDLEAELGLAAGALEGSLAALRRLTSEFVRALDDAAVEVSTSAAKS
jgi:serine/threonine protein kinase